MGKAKTLLGRTKSSGNTLKLKKDVKLSKHNPFKVLIDEALIAQAFWECLKENDSEALNRSHLA